MDIRACDLISGQASTSHSGHQCSQAPGRTDPPSLLILSQTSAGNVFCSGYVIAASSFFGLCCRWRGIGIKRIGSLPDPSSRLECPATGQDAPRRCGRACWRVRSPARCDAAASLAARSGLSPWRSQIFGLISTTHAACTNRNPQVAIAHAWISCREWCGRRSRSVWERAPARRQSRDPW